jgi:hypothetical protein
MRLRIPNEVFLNLLNLPVWGIFVGWAATYLAGGPNRATLARLYPAMPPSRRNSDSRSVLGVTWHSELPSMRGSWSVHYGQSGSRPRVIPVVHRYPAKLPTKVTDLSRIPVDVRR